MENEPILKENGKCRKNRVSYDIWHNVETNRYWLYVKTLMGQVIYQKEFGTWDKARDYLKRNYL